MKSKEGRSAQQGFNRTSRAYPDLTFASINYEIVVGGTLIPILDGTSASTPSVAGLFTMLNSLRLAQNKPPVGFVNPTLYQHGTEGCCKDITEGANYCTVQAWSVVDCQSNCWQTYSKDGWGNYSACTIACNDRSCNAGFQARSGWDPASGLGSPDFHRLCSLFEVDCGGAGGDAGCDAEGVWGIVFYTSIVVVLLIALVGAVAYVARHWRGLAGLTRTRTGEARQTKVSTTSSQSNV